MLSGLAAHRLFKDKGGVLPRLHCSLMPMKFNLLRLTLLLLALGAVSLIAQVATAKKSGVESRLAQALKLFPEADTNKDGTLSIDEALLYVELHPEVKDKLRGKQGSKVSSKPATFAPGAEGTKVFVCAHSFMIYTAGMLPAIAKAADVLHLNAGQQMIGGSQVIQHWKVPDEQNQAKKALKEGMADVLTLSPHLLMPDEGIDNFTKLGLEKNPNLRVYVQASWAPRDGKMSDFTNSMRDAVTAEEVRQMRDTHYTSWQTKLEAQVKALNTAVGKEAVCIIPASTAVYALRERIAEGTAPGLTKQTELFRDDLGHPTEVMALLVTYCHFAAIYQRSPVGIAVPASLKTNPQAEALNKLLQEIAWQAVSTYPMSGVKIASASL